MDASTPPAATSNQRSVFWSTAGTAVSAALNLGMLYALSRLLGPADLGVVLVAMTFLDVVLLFAEMGIGNALIRELATLKPTDQAPMCHTAFWLIQGLALAGAAFLASTGPVWAWVFHNPALGPMMPWVGLGILPLGWAAPQRAMLQSQGRFKAFAGAEVVGMVTAVCVTLGLAWQGWGPLAYFIGFLARKIVEALWASIAAGWRSAAWPWAQHGQHRWEATTAKRLLQFGAQTSAGYALAYGVRPVESAVLSWLLTPSQFGVYAFASLMVYFPINKLTFALNRVFIAKLSSLRLQPLALLQQFQRQVQISLMLGAGVMAMMAIVMPSLAQWAFGPQWQALGTLVPILTIYGVLTTVMRLAEPLAVALGRPQVLIGLNSLLLLSIALCLWLMAPHGMSWAAWGMALAHTPVAILALWFVDKATRSVADQAIPASAGVNQGMASNPMA
jgi:O-antigen/teichoic acid export membrane protein